MDSGDRRSFGAKTAFGEKGSEYWQKGVRNVLLKQMSLFSRRGLRTLDCIFLRYVFCCIHGNTYCTKTLLFLVRYMKYLLYTFFLTKTPIDVLAGGRYAFGNKKLPDIYQRR